MQGQAALGRSANVSVYGIDPEIAREVPQRPRRYSCAHSLPEDAAPQNTRKFSHLHAFTRVYTLASDPAGAINGVVVNAQRNEGALDIYIVAEIPFSNPVGYHPQMHLLSSPFFWQGAFGNASHWKKPNKAVGAIVGKQSGDR